MRSLLYKVTEIGFVWYEIRAHSKIKMTEDPLANEIDKRANHSLSKVSPLVI